MCRPVFTVSTVAFSFIYSLVLTNGILHNCLLHKEVRTSSWVELRSTLRAYEGDGLSARDTTEVITLTPAVTDVHCGLIYYAFCLALVSAEFKTSLTFPQE